MVAEQPTELELAGLRFQVGIFEEALTRNPDDTESLRFLAHGYSVLGRQEDGLAADRRLVALLPRDSRARYNLACSCALTGRYDEAILGLTEAVRRGFSDLKLLRRDRDLDGLRKDPRFVGLLEDLARKLSS